MTNEAATSPAKRTAADLLSQRVNEAMDNPDVHRVLDVEVDVGEGVLLRVTRVDEDTIKVDIDVLSRSYH